MRQRIFPILAVLLLAAALPGCQDAAAGDRAGLFIHFIDPEQTNALAQILRYCVEHQLLERYTVADTVALVQKEITKGGLSAISDSSYAAMGLCMPRVQEIFACMNRYRG